MSPTLACGAMATDSGYDIVTAEQLVFSEDVDAVVAPGVEGQLGILPHHTPLMTMLQPGELRVRKSGEEFSLAISGGFLEVRPDRVIVLADAAERADEIDIALVWITGFLVGQSHLDRETLLFRFPIDFSLFDHSFDA